MLPSEIRVLNALRSSPVDMKTLAAQIGCSYTRTTEIVKALTKKRFVEKDDGKVRLTGTLQASIYQKISSKYDMGKLLGGKGEDISVVLLTNSDLRGLKKQTGFTYQTIRRALSRMMETGAVRQVEKNYQIADDEILRLFIASLREMRTTQTIEPSAEAIPTPGGATIFKVPQGKFVDGYLTAFSAFSEYGVELRTTHDYYIQQRQKPSLEEVLIHALMVATSPYESTDCAVFLAKNLIRVDLGKARRIANNFGVEQLFFDMENYIRNVSNPENFLPWEEFAEKARLYDFDPEQLLPKQAYPDFFNLLSTNLEAPLRLYIFGGEAMRIKGIKRATKDVDVVVADDSLYRSLRKALLTLGYTELGDDQIPLADQRLHPSGIFINEKYPRVDVFTHTICGKFILTSEMSVRAEVKQMAKLTLEIASSEDLLLLKSVTEREGDIQDMITLARIAGFKWGIVLNELIHQEELTGRHFCMDLLDSIEVVQKRAGIKAPIHNKLERRCLDQSIMELLDRESPITVKQIREYIKYPEYRIESRLKALVKEDKLTAVDGKTYALVNRA